MTYLFLSISYFVSSSVLKFFFHLPFQLSCPSPTNFILFSCVGCLSSAVVCSISSSSILSLFFIFIHLFSSLFSSFSLRYSLSFLFVLFWVSCFFIAFLPSVFSIRGLVFGWFLYFAKIHMPTSILFTFGFAFFSLFPFDLVKFPLLCYGSIYFSLLISRMFFCLIYIPFLFQNFVYNVLFLYSFHIF